MGATGPSGAVSEAGDLRLCRLLSSERRKHGAALQKGSVPDMEKTEN